MRSKALPPARAQGHIMPFLEAAALFAALCIFARTAALMLAAAITAPLPMAETLFWLGRQSAQEQPASSVQVEAVPDSTPEAAASSLPQAVQALTGNIEDYLVPLLGEEARPADAGTVIEKNYPQGSGEKYIPCGAGSIKNNTRQTAADIAAEIENPLPFAIEPNSPDPQVLVMHTHATEDYRLSAGLWFAPGDGARSTDCSVNMCAVGRVVADTLNAAGINTLQGHKIVLDAARQCLHGLRQGRSGPLRYGLRLCLLLHRGCRFSCGLPAQPEKGLGHGQRCRDGRCQPQRRAAGKDA